MRLILALLTATGMFVPMATAQDLSATMRNDGEWISGFQPLEFILNRPPAPGERLELVAGTTDVSDLCSVHGDTLLYQPRAVSLPPGPLSVTLSLITPEGTWKQVATFTVNVLTATALEKASIIPSLSIANKGQPAEDHFPDAIAGGRGTFQELNGQLALKIEAERHGLQAGLNFNLIGVSFRQEAIRFAEKQEDAAKVDLSSYLLEIRAGGSGLSLGHFSHGRARHLLNGFASRGTSLSIAVAPYVDLSAASLNATTVVGWDNLAGLDNPNHRIYSGTIGLEILPSTPGAVRVEASYVHANQLPISNFNQGQITDPERSRGGAVRLQLSDPGRNITLDAGLTKTRFTNPPDPFASQDVVIVPTEPTTRQARYADITWNILQSAVLFNALPTRLNLAFRHERVDPLYRAVGVSLRSDILQNTYELHGGIGPIQVDVSHLRSEDNLDGLASVLKTMTRQTSANTTFSPFALAGAPSWVPTLTYGLNTTHQFGAGTPNNSEFTATRVPDQVTTSQTAAIEWQINPLRAGYRGTFTKQDNRQVGREGADAANRVHSASLSVSPFTQVALTIEGSRESMENSEIGAITRTSRIGLGLSASLFPGVTTNFLGSLTKSKNDDGSDSQEQASFSVEGSYAFDLSSSLLFAWRGQIFMRYGWNEAVSRSALLDLHSTTRSWVITTGVSFSLF